MKTVPFSNPDRFFVGGEWVRPSTSSLIDVVVPATEELYVRVAEAHEADLNRAVASARAAFDSGVWPRLSHAERASFLLAMAKKLAERTADVADIWSNEMGILNSHAQNFVSATAQKEFEYYASLADSFNFEERHAAPEGKVGLLVREPVGVVGAIIPWNGPIIMIAMKIAPALLAGCTIVLKSSPEAPGAAYVMAEIAAAIGLPPGVLNVITADRAVSELLVRHPDVDKITFTGSSATGQRIASLCGERIARCTLELGGKSAAVILDDYDIQTAVDTISATACIMTGQVCAALTRVIVTRSRHDQLVEALSASFRVKRVGDPFDPTVDLGPVAMRRQRDRIEQLIHKGKEEGATLATGGGRPSHLNRGFFIEPTIFGNVHNHSTIAREEIFGPVLCVIPADDEADAVAIANDTRYGLNNSVFTNDPVRAYEVARQLRSGTVGHNECKMDSSIGFGGFKQSGIGREGGVEGLLPFLESKTIVIKSKAYSAGPNL